MIHAAERSAEINPAKLAMLFKREFELCAVKRGETIALVSDLGTRREYVQAAFAAADELGADTYEMCVNAIPGWTKVGVPTIGQCKGTLEALSHADLMVIFHVPLFTQLAEDRDGPATARADDHRRARRPRAADVAAGPQGGDEVRRRRLPQHEERAGGLATPAPTSAWTCGEYPVMTQ